MLDNTLTILGILSSVLISLWFIRSKSKKIFERTILLLLALNVLISSCVYFFVLGANNLAKTFAENPEYSLPEWYDSAPTLIGVISFLVMVAIFVVLFLFDALHGENK